MGKKTKVDLHISIRKDVFDLSLFFYESFNEHVFRHHNCCLTRETTL